MATSPKETSITVRLDRAQADQVDRLAVREHEARSIIVRRLLRRGIEAERHERRDVPSGEAA